tara:strand:+ start:15 stop:314 length:300 start_codon:yes stop_codon:yes gene_type:complete
MNLIRNFSVLILFFGIILLTIYITKSYSLPIDNKIKQYKEDQAKQDLEDNIRKENSTKPSKMFSRMFSEPTVWMGNSDPDTITRNNNQKSGTSTYRELE